MKITKRQLKALIREQVAAVLEGIDEYHEDDWFDVLAGERGSPISFDTDGTEASMTPNEEESDLLEKKKKKKSKAKRTAKGNITQAAREKHATVGKDKFPIFDKKSAEAAIDLRGHTSKKNQKKIINKAAKYAPAAAKKAREAEKNK